MTQIRDRYNAFEKQVARRMKSLLPLALFLLGLHVADAIAVTYTVGLQDTSQLNLYAGILATLFGAWLLPSLFSNKPIRQTIAWIEAIVVSLLFIYEWHLIWSAQTVITNSVMLQYLTDNPHEAQADLLFTKMPWQSWLQGIGIVGVWAWICFLPQTIIKPLRRLGYPWAIVIGLLAFALYFLPRHLQRYSSQTMLEYAHISPFERFVLGTRLAIEDIRNTFKIHSHQVTTQLVDAPQAPHNVVVIIGESLRRQDMHCYGYPLENTPQIDSLIASGDLVLYDDVVTCRPNTVGSIRSVMTLHLVDSGNESWWNYPALPTLFRAAGYRTYWTSNQEPGGKFIQPIAAIATTCDTTHYLSYHTTETWWASANHVDGELLTTLSDYRNEGNDKFLQIVHLYGSHQEYKDRYPSSYERFSGKDIAENHLHSSQKQRAAEYMNSIYYNDYVVSEIIKKYSTQSSIVFYFSDHGITRYDNPDEPEQFGHNNYPTALTIPMMVYVSPSFRAQNPHIYSQLTEAVHRPMMTDVFTHSIAALMGIKGAWSRPELEFWGKGYNLHRPRIIEAWGLVTEMPARYTQSPQEKQSKR